MLLLAAVATLHRLFLFCPDVLPITFIEVQDLTPFKIAFEYGLMRVNAVAAALFLRQMRRPHSFNNSGLFAAAAIMAQGEFFFTLYGSVSDTYNLGGNAYKVIACSFLYRSAFVATVPSPYTQLRTSKMRLQAILDALLDVLLEMDDKGRHLQVHTGYAGSPVAPPDQLLGKTLHEIPPPQSAQTAYAALAEAQDKTRQDKTRVSLGEAPCPLQHRVANAGLRYP